MEKENNLKSYDLLAYIENTTSQKAKLVGADTYRFKTCPLCGTGDHFNVNTNKNLFNGFTNDCGGGSIIDFHAKYYGKSIEESIKELNIYFDFNKEEAKPILEKPAKTYKEIDLTSAINNYYNSDNNYLGYFISRGILEDEVTNKYQLCGGNIKTIFKDNLDLLPNIKGYNNVIPVWRDGKVVNCILKGKGLNAINLKGPQVRLLNADYLKSEKVIFITEGIFDCLSIECLGYKSTCLNSVNMALQLIQLISKYKFLGTKFILALDNDSAGVKTNAKLTEELTKLNIDIFSLTVPKEIGKDVNDWYLADKEQLKKELARLYKLASFDYLDEFQKHVIENKYLPIISTGHKQLDSKLNSGLFSGLYTIGAISSLGKTAFVLQIADNIAKEGQKVLFFSLEMPKDELIARSISRIMFTNNPSKCADIGTFNVNYGRVDYCQEEYKKAINEYREIMQNLDIIQCDFGTDIKFIIDYVNNYIETTGTRPVVIIDYLQIIKANKTDKYVTEKEKIDSIVVELKRLSNKKLPVIVVSSFNRDSYQNPVTYNSFKESGGIEYTSDFVIGLQLSILDDIKNAGEVNKVKKNDMISKSIKDKNPREVTLVVLKNRNGASNTSVKYNFYGKNNLFIERSNFIDDSI